VVGIYNDDLFITSSDHNNIKSFNEEMVIAFKMNDLDLLHYYLGIRVQQRERYFA
jgi:hypothetical protein